MPAKELGKLEEKEDFLEIWKDGEKDFNIWLANDKNIVLLGEALGIDIHVEDTEAPIGDLYADIIAREKSTGRRIVIENQRTETDHDHLGKLITYAANTSAYYIVWIAWKIRPEHRAAVQWLNQHTDDSTNFFLCELRVFTIGDSGPAVKFDLAASPMGWRNKPTLEAMHGFWDAFWDYASENERFTHSFPHKVTPNSDGMRVTYKLGQWDCNISLLYRDGASELRISLYLAKDLGISDAAAARLQKELDCRPQLKKGASENQDRISVNLQASQIKRDSWNELFLHVIEIMSAMKEVYDDCLSQQ